MDSDGIFGSLGTIVTLAIGVVSAVVSIKKKREEKSKTTVYDEVLDDWEDDRQSPEAYVEIVSRKDTAGLSMNAVQSDTVMLADELNAPEEKPERKKEKIDLRKMIIYSEILKPKFDEGLK